MNTKLTAMDKLLLMDALTAKIVNTQWELTMRGVKPSRSQEARINHLKQLRKVVNDGNMYIRT